MVSGPTANIGGDRPIMWCQILSRDYVVLAVTFALAREIYAGTDKACDPLQFVESIATFVVLPAVFINCWRLVCRSSRLRAAFC
jgi:hypothetical protein